MGEAEVPFEVPRGEELAARLPAVLEVLFQQTATSNRTRSELLDGINGIHGIAKRFSPSLREPLFSSGRRDGLFKRAPQLPQLKSR